MAKTLDQKKTELGEIKENLQKAKSVIFANFKGVKTEDLNKLRDNLYKNRGSFAVFKNTLIIKALNSLNLPKVQLFGSTALIFSFQDAVSSIKDAFKFKKDGLAIEIRHGLVEGKLLNATQVEEVSKLPTREILLEKVLGGLNAPLVGFAGVLGGTQRKFLYAISSLREKR